MTPLHSLWLPILLSAVAVFVASSLLHLLTPWHKDDYAQLPDQDHTMEALRALAIPPGDYMVPKPKSREELSSGEFAERMKKGPVMVLTVIPAGPPAMGSSLALWFVYSLVVGAFGAYVTGRALPPGAHYLAVFRMVSTIAWLGYSAALWQMSIWYRRAWGTTLKATVDGLVYALLTGGVLGWLWPR
ncbi:MAG TPA: hypothetical protein VMX54_11315 [Vicinamibacteria bacterium]|nr:hypothetical protein [Vicinamibacteria bacterium]